MKKGEEIISSDRNNSNERFIYKKVSIYSEFQKNRYYENKKCCFSDILIIRKRGFN